MRFFFASAEYAGLIGHASPQNPAAKSRRKLPLAVRKRSMDGDANLGEHFSAIAEAAMELPSRRPKFPSNYFKYALFVGCLLIAVFAATRSTRAQQPAAPGPQAPLAAAPQSAAPAFQPVARKPRIGLVLEGGGALGLAHIGVIQWLEEHHIPVSYVAGTSMGGLVGGVYATGHSPKEIETLISGIQWDEVLQGKIPFQDLTFRRKQDAVDYPNSLEFGLRHGLQFPEGFNSGQQVGLIFDKIALPYSEIRNFNDLPIPFGCVSTDLLTGKEEIFRSGSLALALRSTMSLPGIFTPVREQDHIFADGALLDNLPVDVAQDMGADVTLAVHLQVKGLDPKSSLSTFTVLGRSLSVVIAANELRSMEKADVLISVPLEDYSSLDYSRGPEMIKAGYDAAASKAAVLLAFSVDDDSWAKYLAHRNSRKRNSVPTPQFVDVQGTSPELTALIQTKLTPLVGKPIDAQALEQQLNLLIGYGRFNSLGYKVVEKDGKQGLLITAVEKPYSPPSVQPLLLLDGSDYDNPLFSVGAESRFTTSAASDASFATTSSSARNTVSAPNTTFRCASAAIGSLLRAPSPATRPFTPTTKTSSKASIAIASSAANSISDTKLAAMPKSASAIKSAIFTNRFASDIPLYPRKTAASALPKCNLPKIASTTRSSRAAE
jgi:predicted acylesterase/phospholipase RssA